MINLLSNAIKYTATNSKVTVSYRVITRGAAVAEARHALCSDLLLAEAAAATAAAMNTSGHGSSCGSRRRRNSSAGSGASASADAGGDVAVQRSDNEPVVVVTIADQGKGLPVAVSTNTYCNNLLSCIAVYMYSTAWYALSLRTVGQS
jgi:signal transduction histidine kinase